LAVVEADQLAGVLLPVGLLAMAIPEALGVEDKKVKTEVQVLPVKVMTEPQVLTPKVVAAAEQVNRVMAVAQ
jgi:hypothetical protein